MQPQVTSPKRLVLLDGHALLFRAFHAMPALTTPDGRPSGGVYGVVNVVIRVLRELEPTWMIACFDSPGITFRDELYPDYKATRAETPPDVRAQEPMVKEALEALAIPHVALSGFEADDLIATLARQALAEKVDEIVIVTGDRDLLQLADSRVKIYLLRGGIKDIMLLNGAAVTELIGVRPEQILEWKALVGDASDNIIGLPGIGPKTATELIKKFGTLKKLYQAVKQEVKSQKPKAKIKESLRDILLTHEQRAMQNRELLKLREDVPITLDLEAASRSGYDDNKARAYLASLGFKAILNRLPGNLIQKTLFGYLLFLLLL